MFGSAYNLFQPAPFVAKSKMFDLPPSRLYRSLGDYDVLRGIFTEHIGTQPITQKALEAEARGDYSLALKLYNEVRSNKGHETTFRILFQLRAYCSSEDKWSD